MGICEPSPLAQHTHGKHPGSTEKMAARPAWPLAATRTMRHAMPDDTRI